MNDLSGKSYGVSPVIGVILLVGLTVSLSIIAAVTVFDVSGDLSEPATADVKLVEKKGYVEATIISNENVEKFIFEGPNGDSKTLTNTGDVKSLRDGTGVYDLIGKTSSSQSVIMAQINGKKAFEKSRLNDLTITVQNSSDSSPIKDAIVEVYSITNTTKSDGKTKFKLEDNTYSVEVNKNKYKSKTIDITVNGDTTETIQLEPVDTSVSGTVSTNPDINDATVKAILNDGSVIKTTTDTSGSYSINKDPTKINSVVVNASGEDQVNGNDFYASAEQAVESSQYNLNFTFVNRIQRTVNGTTISVSYDISENRSKPKMIGNIHQLQLINTDLSGRYVLVNNIEADTTDWNNGNGFEPIGDSTSKFNGSIIGNNHTINDLYIDRNNTGAVGLISYTAKDAVIRNLSIKNGNISGKEEVGGFIGQNEDATLSKLSYSGKVSSPSGNLIGGIIGYNTNGGVYSGFNFTSGSVKSGGDNVGGLIGENIAASISESYVKGDVSGGENVGGIIGVDNFGDHKVLTKNGTTVGSGDNVGALIGNLSNGDIIKSYANGSVSGRKNVGGLVGYNNGDVNYSYSATSVSSNNNNNVGGLVGNNKQGQLSYAYWNTDLTNDGIGESGSGGSKTEVSGLTTADMKGSSAVSNMPGLDFTNNWETVESGDGDTTKEYYPILDGLERQEQLEVFEIYSN